MNVQQAARIILWGIGGILLMVATLLVIVPPVGTHRPLVGNLKTQGAKVISAIERYRISQGTLPDNLTQLVPRYLPRLDEVEYQYNKAYKFPHSLLNRNLSSPWAYKTSHNKSTFALAVKAKPQFLYDSKDHQWYIYDNRFQNYEKPPPPATPSAPISSPTP